MSNETEKFDWYKVLDKAIESEPDGYVQRKLSAFAGSWVTCACGQLCKSLPRGEIGQPEDVHLLRLGGEFNYRIKNLNWLGARSTLDKIEDRTAHLLANTEL